MRRWSEHPGPIWLVALLLWLWVAVPLLSGERTLYYRDVLWTHAHFKAFGAEELRQGRIPAFNPDWALGQAFRGNPNALAFYPGNLLYLVLPFASAFHLHYMAHWLLALAAMWLLARRLGQGPLAALCAGLTYAGGGWLLSAVTFYNILAVSAWWPLVLWGMVRGDRRGLVLGGVACGLAFLGGEPVTLLIGLVPLAVLAWRRYGARSGLARLAVLGSVAVLVALPQIVATLRVLDFTLRGGHGLLPIAVDAYSLHPVRLLELLVPFPFGSPALAGSEGFWSTAQVPRVPYILTLHCGVVGLALALAAGRRRPAWVGLALAGLLAAWLGGVFGELLWSLSGGLFRSPEKFLFWFALAVPLLAGWGVERWAVGGRSRGVAVAAIAMLLLGALVAAFAADFVAAVADSLARAGPPGDGGLGAVAGVEAHVWLWAWALLRGGALLALLAWAVRWRRQAPLVALQLASLAALAPLLMSAGSDLLRPGPLAEGLPAGTGVVASKSVDPPWESVAVDVRGPQSDVVRVWIESLSSPVSLLHGMSWPLARDLDGMHSPLFSLMSLNLGRDDWPVRVTWCRALGAGVLVTSRPVRSPHLRLEKEIERYGTPFRLYEVLDAAPEAWWPESTAVAESPAAAFRRVSELADPVRTVVTDRPVTHRAGATVRLLSHQPDRLEIDVRGAGGVLALRRAYHPLWRAAAGGESLPTLPVNLDLLGVLVPPGEHRVVLSVASWPELTALAVSWSTMAAVLFVVAGRGRRGRRGRP